MSKTVHKGIISFIHHTKKNAVIDYEDSGKKKTVGFKTDADASGTDKKAKKPHQYRVGDEVNFTVRLSDRGDKMLASDIRFLYNTALEKLIHKAKTDNSFKGYLKKVDEEYYVKEIDSYLFFPLTISRWQKSPPESSFNEAVSFRLLNPDKPYSIAAGLMHPDYSPEYRKAQHHFTSKTPVEATITRVSPYAIYLNLFGDKVTAKLDMEAGQKEEWKEGDTIKIIITYLSESRMVVKQAP